MTPFQRRTLGFTLIELMVSMAIGSMLLLAAALLLASSGDGYERVGGGVSAEREARALINRLASDLSTAIFHKDGVTERSPATWAADQIGFLCLQSAPAQSDAGRIGDLCAVHYYLKDLTIGGRTVRCLMRGLRESSETFKALGNGSVPQLFAPRDTLDEPVAFGVVSFEARSKSRDASGKWIDWIHNDETGPEALEVRLVLVRRSLAARLTTSGDWDGEGLLGSPSEAERNKELEIYGAMIRFGNHEKS